jgi:hypothetical protein
VTESVREKEIEKEGKAQQRKREASSCIKFKYGTCKLRTYKIGLTLMPVDVEIHLSALK